MGMLSAVRKALSVVGGRGGGWQMLVGESYPGAWQQNVEVKFDSVLSFHADFACKTLIASDVAKLRLKLVKWSEADQVWVETTNPAYSPVLRKPNHWQNRIQFFETWVISKLQRGNTYVLKRRHGSGVVKALSILDPTRVTPLVSDSGEVFYRLSTDNLAGLEGGDVTVPASEIIHDRFNCLFHPLVGLSPIFASGLAAMQGLAIQNASTKSFQRGSVIPGVLTAPGSIDDATAKRLKEYWEEHYTGDDAIGKIAVLGDGLNFVPMAVKAVDAQLIEQLKWSAEVVCSTYHVPPYKIGVGPMPTVNNVQSLNIEYYSQCLQVLIEAIELSLDEGLGTGELLGTEFDIDNLLRMDSASQMEMLDKGRNYLTPNEGRRRVGLPKIAGGEVVYRQQQDFSLEALAKRDAKADPFEKAGTSPSGVAPAAGEPSVDPKHVKSLFAVCGDAR